MLNIIGIFYFIAFISFLLAALFVVFHIVKYSINKMSSFVMLVIFVLVFIILLISNVALFFSLPWEQMLDFSGLNNSGF